MFISDTKWKKFINNFHKQEKNSLHSQNSLKKTVHQWIKSDMGYFSFGRFSESRKKLWNRIVNIAGSWLLVTPIGLRAKKKALACLIWLFVPFVLWRQKSFGSVHKKWTWRANKFQLEPEGRTRSRRVIRFNNGHHSARFSLAGVAGVSALQRWDLISVLALLL